MYFCLVDSMSVLSTVVEIFKIFSHTKTAIAAICRQMNNFGLKRSRIYWNVLIPHCKAYQAQILPENGISSIIFDGLVLLHLLNPAIAVTFDDYASRVFIPFLSRESNAQSELMLFGIAT
eukprot:Pompholyxophrys_punicea_v1_NODE_93_length_3578_cov_92.823162.p3 type:complete len:120 gc:universal NODE_93_length_3578_cov_92.823162:1171-812(-)